MRALRYALDEALASLARGRVSGLLSIVTIALAVIVPGGFLLVTTNLQRLGAEWSKAAELSVYLKDEATPADRRVIEGVLAQEPEVAEREAVSKAEALKRFKQTFGDLATAVDAAGDNPLPASYEVRMKPASQTGAIERLAARLQKLSGVSDVRYDRQWLDRVLTAIAVLRAIGVLLGLILATAAALTVANVVRLALSLRRDELEIMELVGAPQVYVHGPFIMEGVLQGGVGAAIALAGLLAGFVVIRARYLAPLASAVDVGSIRFLSPGLCVGLVVAGMLVGCLGAILAARTRA